MKTKAILMTTAMFAISLLFICTAPIVNAQIGRVAGGAAHGAAGDAKAMAKKALTEGKVEIIDCKMEKITDEERGTYIIVTGTAIYTPAKIRKKPLKDIGFGLKADFYDAKGKKLGLSAMMTEYGENNQPENVEYKKPFPFSGEVDKFTALGDPEKKQGKIIIADYCVIRGWNTVKEVSTKDSK